MLGAHTPIATVAVKDLKAARSFYAETLGLKLADANEETLTFTTGSGQLLVYRSSFAGTNQATAVTWSLGRSFDSVLETLRARGVLFEHYQFPDTRLERDAHVVGDDFRVAWFKDPDGNIHSLMNA